MADLAKSGTPSLATLNPPPSQQKTLPAFTDMAAGDMVYIKSDGTFALTDGTALDAKSDWWGMINRACKAGQPVTAYWGVEFRYGASLTPGAPYYIDTVAGGLDTATTTGGTTRCAFATGTDTIFILPPRSR